MGVSHSRVTPLSPEYSTRQCASRGQIIESASKAHVNQERGSSGVRFSSLATMVQMQVVIQCMVGEAEPNFKDDVR